MPKSPTAHFNSKLSGTLPHLLQALYHSGLENHVQEGVSIKAKWTDTWSAKCKTLPSLERSSAGGRGRKNIPKSRGHLWLAVTPMPLAFTTISYHHSLSSLSEKDAADHVAVLPGSQAQTGLQTGLLWSHRLWLFNWWKLQGTNTYHQILSTILARCPMAAVQHGWHRLWC